LVCPGFTSHDVWITTGEGKLFTALSVTLAIVCTAPEETVTLKALGAVAARDMIRAWPESSRALNVILTLRARSRYPSLRNLIGSLMTEVRDYWTIAWRLRVPV
jgi:hypothetical protein